MTDKRVKKPSMEVSSEPLQDELIAIKDRLSAIETIQSISNASVVRKYVEEHLTSVHAKSIMRECRMPRTRTYLMTTLGFNSPQALDYHLKPLRKADLVRQVIEDDTVLFEWSNLFRALPNSSIRAILPE